MTIINETPEVIEQLSWLVIPEISKDEALNIFHDQDPSVLLVLEKGRLTGMVSDGDQSNRVVLCGKSFDEARLRKILNRNCMDTSYDQTVMECMALTQQYEVLHLPVMVDGYLMGIISVEDLASIILLD